MILDAKLKLSNSIKLTFFFPQLFVHVPIHNSKNTAPCFFVVIQQCSGNGPFLGKDMK